MKVPVGNISLSEAFEQFHEDLWRNSPTPETPSPGEHQTAGEEVRRSTATQKEFEEVFANGTLEARVLHGERELTITPRQWKDTCSPARAFFGGPIEDFCDGPLADYRGLFPYVDEAAFKNWLRSRPKTRAAGRPSSLSIVMAEFERRQKDGCRSTSRSAEANTLSEWLWKAHKLKLAPKTIRNQLPPDFQPFKTSK